MSIKNGVARKRDEEWRRYAKTVREGQRDFVKTGTALGMLRVEDHHKEQGYASFEDLVEAEFDMPKTTAYRLIEAARVVTVLSQLGTIQSKITNQAQALALSPIRKDAEALMAVIAMAEGTGRITAATLDAARTELYPHVKVIDGEVVGDRPEVVDGMRAAIESVEENQKKKSSPGSAGPGNGEEDAARIRGRAVSSEPPKESGPVDGSSPVDGAGTTPADPPLPPDVDGETENDAQRAGADVGQPELDHPALAEPGAAEDEGPQGGESSDVDAGQTAFTQTDPGETPTEPGTVDGREQQDSAGVSDPAALGPVELLEELAEKYEALDVDVLGPLMTSAELAALGFALDRVVNIVELLTKWHERAKP